MPEMKQGGTSSIIENELRESHYQTHAASVEEGAAAASTPGFISPIHKDGTPLTEAELAEAETMALHNAGTVEAYSKLPFDHPVGRVFWIHIDHVQANDYNPNSVAKQEMTLLHTSIAEDGYTQPIVAIWDPTAGPDKNGRFVIVDGFHRYTTMRMYADIYDLSNGYTPLVVLEKSVADRIAATVRHNRARGKHSVAGMSNLVFGMLKEGQDDATICAKLGLEAEELARLKHITGYSKLFGGKEYSKVMLTSRQLEEKVKYKKEHPDEHIPRA
jgi:ParB-like chromosome segregation protein Spo0J